MTKKVKIALAAIAAGFTVIVVTPVVMLFSIGEWQLLRGMRNAITLKSDVIVHFATVKELDQPGIEACMIPRQAVDIKCFYTEGFGWQACTISCSIGYDDLMRFAAEKGYQFITQKEPIDVGSNNPITDELARSRKLSSRYLCCVARENHTHEVNLPGWGDFGNLYFVYDIGNSRLYVGYDD